MTAFFLSEGDVRFVADMPLALAATEQAFQELATGRAVNIPRSRAMIPGVILHSMSAASTGVKILGTKSYTTTKQGAQFLVTLWDAETGKPLCVMEADYLGQLRTGAASGLSCKLMSNPESRIVGCFGSGLQARTQLQAICMSRPIERIEVYSRNSEKCSQFADEVSQLCDVPTIPVHSPDDAASEKDILVCATTSKSPVFQGASLTPGTHLCVVGSNHLSRAEIDLETIRRSDWIACDDLAACQNEAGDFVAAIEAGCLEWQRVQELGRVLVGEQTGRAHEDDITLFKSVGLAIQDIILGTQVYIRAREEGLGQPLPF
ncbi:L-lysine cyclodeaminase [Planctopirus ephydatiae]|uniref:L-lysine cyclodeaminase n=1 Tax=Planctopirus ephydatiae TaxID=2528019 RepID=A0A518GLR2_9PLAN|nr:ornithine cyclodeaminase family protein [Planctopirus ephydatiae]QDV29593.1 L-lysine cyclodeaminase [Planctopirus ephydatiae]